MRNPPKLHITLYIIKINLTGHKQNAPGKYIKADKKTKIKIKKEVVGYKVRHFTSSKLEKVQFKDFSNT